ncbi:hypothetical protein FGB62_40g172 [Gracilaria domingensis]|nr:hypothetical protein FGB62_40g172 [Gracilaria domingensis]
MSRRGQWGTFLKGSLQKLQTVVDKIDTAQTNAAHNNALHSTGASSEMPKVNQVTSNVNGQFITDEKTKSWIISAHKEVFMTIMASTPAQIPIINLLDSGVVETYWGSVDDLLLFAQNIHGFPKHLSQQEQLSFLERKSSQTSSRDGVQVHCEIALGTLVCVRETYPSYQIMLKMCREDMENQFAQLSQMKQAQEGAETQTVNQMRMLQFRLQSEQEQREAILRKNQEHLTRLGQIMGTTPRYYKNGVPHYGGF